MSKIADTIPALCKEGEILLGIIPNKSAYDAAEKRIGEKYFSGHSVSSAKSEGKSQLDILRTEYDAKLREATRRYKAWYAAVLEILSSENNNELIGALKKSKENLYLQKRIASVLDILKSVSEKKQKQQMPRADESRAYLPIIMRGESDTVEFKSSLRWDAHMHTLNKHLEVAVAKAIAAFLNSKGGTLFIGVGDNKTIVGVSSDYPTLRVQNSDGFIQYLVQVINNRMGKEYNKYISTHIEKIEGKDVCVVAVSSSERPVFLRSENTEEFYIRASATSQPLNVREASEYITMHFKK